MQRERTTAVKHHWMILGWVMALGGVAAMGVTPGVWRQDSEQDFTKAQRKNTVVDSHGDVTLSRAIEILLPADEAPPVVSAVAVMNDAIYAASGVDGEIFRVADGKAASHAKLPSTIVTCLYPRDGTLLAAGGGEQAGLYAIAEDKTVKKLFDDPSVNYIWAVAPGPNDSLYLATGPEAKLWRLDAAGKSEMLFQADASLAKHLLCLAIRGDGKLLVGTDENGLVFEIDPKTKASRVILDAEEKEISVLLTDGEGGCHAATSDTEKAAALSQPGSGAKNGRPDQSGETTKPKITPVPSIPPAEEPKTKPDKPSDPNDAMGKPVFAQSPPIDPPSGRDIQAQATHAPDGSVTITLPAGQKLPVIELGGRRVVMIQDLTTGQVREIPAENVRVEHAPRLAAADPTSSQPAQAPALPKRTATPPTPSGKGNAVYYVNASGMVHAIFRRPGTIQAMVRRGERLYLAAGDEGRVYFVTLDGALHGEVIDTDAKQVTALIPAEKDALLFATSNAGSVGRISAKPAAEGTLISQPLDAKQIAQWGTLKLTGAAPDGSRVTVATRSGNLTPAADATWSPWTKETPLQEDFTSIGSPAARFLQYRVTLTARDGNEPTLEGVETIYQVANLAPVVSAVSVQATDRPKPPAPKAPTLLYRLVTIQASDPNNDKLEYKIQFQKDGSKVWIEAAKHLKEPGYFWDTLTVEDGKYRLRVIADDKPSNTVSDAMRGTRISEPVIVDNTPPRFDKFNIVLADGEVLLHGSVTDALSRITSLQYSVDSAAKWQTFLPGDGICDSPHETFRAEAPKLKEGSHQITVRATDVFGNVGYASQSVTVRK
ncbi:MAG: hypothetical protein JXA11_08760 [Phycisphaerae bacterium]|nr:hypothetical protein [Phycisphaerae bacterium]